MKDTLCFLLSIILLSCIKEDISDSNGFALQVGNVLPEFSVTNRTETISTDSLRGQIVLIIFFNTTCGDCQKALPAIHSLYEKYSRMESVHVLLIARGQTENDVDKYFHSLGYNLSFFTDPDREVYSLFADKTIPRLFLADKHGKIILTQTEKVNSQEVEISMEAYMK